MELIRINAKKLKLMMTPADMSHFELDSNAIESNPAKIHHAFRRLLNELREKAGFEADHDRLTVQYFPSREGGCEMFISNLGEEKENDATDAKAGRHSLLPHRAPVRISDCYHRELAYRFPTLDGLLSVCERLVKIGYIGESEAYRDTLRCYHLFLMLLAASPFSIPDELAFIVEYGSIENASGTRLYLREHGAPICKEHAVEELSRLS